MASCMSCLESPSRLRNERMIMTVVRSGQHWSTVDQHIFGRKRMIPDPLDDNVAL
jgi:hypothetical protein